MNRFFKNLMNDLNNFDLVQSSGGKPSLEEQFKKEIRLRKEVNSEHVWSSYYIPIATAQIVKEQGTITPKDTFRLECLANSLMFKDMADGKLDEFYRFKECEV